MLGSERKRERALEGLAAAHGVLQARIGREVRMKRTPTLTFEYDPTVEEGVRMSKLMDELALTIADISPVADVPRPRPLLVATHENPDGDTLGSLLGITLGLHTLGKDTVVYLSGDASAVRCRFLRSMGGAPAARRRRHARPRRPRLRGGSAVAARGDLLGDTAVLDIDHHHDDTEFAHVNLVVADTCSTGGSSTTCWASSAWS